VLALSEFVLLIACANRAELDAGAGERAAAGEGRNSVVAPLGATRSGNALMPNQSMMVEIDDLSKIRLECGHLGGRRDPLVPILNATPTAIINTARKKRILISLIPTALVGIVKAVSVNAQDWGLQHQHREHAEYVKLWSVHLIDLH
jgi:hypothetical protein